MTMLYVLAVLVLLALFLWSDTSAQRARRVEDALNHVESTEPAAMASWPTHVRADLSQLLVREQERRSADYRQGMHTSVEAREADYALQERIGVALGRVREAGRIADRTENRSAA